MYPLFKKSSPPPLNYRATMYEITLYIERNKIICDQLHNALTQEAYILF